MGGGRGRNSASCDNGKILAGTRTHSLAIGLNVPTVTRRDCAGMRKALDRVCEGSRKPEPWIRALGGGGGRGHAPLGSVPPPRCGDRALALVPPAGTRDTGHGRRGSGRAPPLPPAGSRRERLPLPQPCPGRAACDSIPAALPAGSPAAGSFPFDSAASITEPIAPAFGSGLQL